jgi:hypothetical protein
MNELSQRDMEQRQKALSPIESSQLNILDFKDQYLRAAQADIRKHNDKAKIKENPLMLDDSIIKYKELFENRKIIYLEHETRHSFVESIIKDPPSFVEQWEIQDLIGRNNDTSKELEAKAKEVASEFEYVTEGQKEAEALDAEIKKLEQELQFVNRELEEAQMPVAEDPDLNLPFDQLVSREIENQALQAELDAQLSQTTNELPTLNENLDSLEQEVEELQQLAERLERQVQQVEQTREEQRTQETRALESAMNSYENYTSILLSLGQLQNLKVESTSPSVEKLSFAHSGRRYDMHVSSVTSRVIDAKVDGVSAATINMVLEKVKSVKADWSLLSFIMEIQETFRNSSR